MTTSHLSILALAVVTGAALLTLHLQALRTSELRALHGSQATIYGIVDSDPHETRARVKGSRLFHSQISFTIRVTRFEANGSSRFERVPVRVLSSSTNVERGDRIRVTGRVVISRENRVAATVVAKEIYVLQSPSGVMGALTHIRLQFRAEVARLGGEPAALIPGIVIGDTSLQSPEFADVMRRAGLSHLTAVSGANFAIVSAFLLWCIQFFVRRRGMRILVVAIFLSLFVALVGPSPSVLRAAAMASVLMFARANGNESLSATSLAAAIGILLLLDPFQAFEPGFILSVLATGALIFLAPSIEEYLSRWIYRWLAALIAVPTAATVVCAPYIIYLSGELSTGTVFFNLLVAPVIGPLTILAFVAAMIAIPFPTLAHIVLICAYPFARWIVSVAHLSASAPTIIAAPVTLVTAFLVLLLIFKRYGIQPIMLFCASLFLVRFLIPSPTWTVAQCDVGQGDALLINLGDGEGLLFDTGPDPRLLDRCLHRFRITSLPLVVLTHMHADHYGGLSVLARYRVGEIWTNAEPTSPIPQGEFERAPHRVVHTGEERTIKGASLQVLWPDQSSSDFATLPGDGSAENDKSIVTLINLKGSSILVTGDIEPPVQELLLRESRLPEITIMKIPHHGSRYQDETFITRSKIALISVGVGNSYGHPGSSTIQALHQAKIRTYRTDQDGAIAIDWRKEKGQGYVFSVHCYRKAWWSIQWR